MSTVTGEARKLRTDPDRPPVAVVEPPGMTARGKIVTAIIALIAVIGWVMLATSRGEHVNSMWIVLAAVGSYLIALRFYATFIERKLLKPDDTRATPAEVHDNGKDFMPTDRRVLFGHHFAAISGAGPLVGPVLASQMGYLPGTLWIIFPAAIRCPTGIETRGSNPTGRHSEIRSSPLRHPPRYPLHRVSPHAPLPSTSPRRQRRAARCRRQSAGHRWHDVPQPTQGHLLHL